MSDPFTEYNNNNMPSKSKTKGNKFENDVVKLFNEMFNTQEFRRTPNSGAMMGRSNASKFSGLSEDVKRTLSSDIITPEWFPFAIECKHYGDKPNYAAIIKEHDTKLDHWIAEAVFDAYNQNLWPMLCFKTDRKGAHVVVPSCLLTLSPWTPSFYTQYDDLFVIVGMDIWCETSPVIFKSIQENSERWLHIRDKFFEDPKLDLYSEILGISFRTE